MGRGRSRGARSPREQSAAADASAPPRTPKRAAPRGRAPAPAGRPRPARWLERCGRAERSSCSRSSRTKPRGSAQPRNKRRRRTRSAPPRRASAPPRGRAPAPHRGGRGEALRRALRRRAGGGGCRRGEADARLEDERRRLRRRPRPPHRSRRCGSSACGRARSSRRGRGGPAAAVARRARQFLKRATGGAPRKTFCSSRSRRRIGEQDPVAPKESVEAGDHAIEQKVQEARTLHYKQWILARRYLVGTGAAVMTFQRRCPRQQPTASRAPRPRAMDLERRSRKPPERCSITSLGSPPSIPEVETLCTWSWQCTSRCHSVARVMVRVTSAPGPRGAGHLRLWTA